MRSWIRFSAAGLIVGLVTACAAPTETVEPGSVVTTPEIGQPAAETLTPEAAGPDLGGRKLLIGTDATYPPFETIDESNAIVGIDPDLMAAICEIAHCEAQFQTTEWAGIFGALAANEFDALMSAITIKPERAQNGKATFTEPYFTVGQVVLVRTDSTITDPMALGDATVAVQGGTTGDTAATENLKVPEERMQRYTTNVLAVAALLNRDADAVVADNPTAELYMKQHPAELRLAGQPFTEEDYGILVPNDTPDVLEAFNAAIGQLKSEGRIDEIVSHWYASLQAAPTATPTG